MSDILGKANDAMSSTVSALDGTATSAKDKTSQLVSQASKSANTLVVDSPLSNLKGERAPPSKPKTFIPVPSPKQSTGSWATRALAWITSLSALKWLLIIIVLALLGLNIFVGLGKATGSAAEVLRPLLSSIGIGVGETVKSTVKAAAAGTKGIVDATAGTVTSGINVIEKRVDGDTSERSAVASRNANNAQEAKKRSPGPEPDQAGSRTQASKPTKGGYCYIGEDRGYRSCLKVNDGSMCESGEIFPTMAKCTNPAVRDTQAMR